MSDTETVAGPSELMLNRYALRGTERDKQNQSDLGFFFR